MIDIANLPRGEKATGWIDVARRPDGGHWRLPYLSVTGDSPGPRLVVSAGVHGDEYEGIEAIPRVYKGLDPAAMSGSLFMVPVCNVPAFETIARSSPVDHLNLARVFPGDADGSITQRIASLLADHVLAHADFYIDLHSGGMAYNMPTLAGYLHGGDLGERSLAGARAFGAPILWGHPPPVAPGRTISCAVEHGVPCLYTEAAGGGLARADDVDCFCNGVLNVARWLGILDGTPQPRPMTHHLIGDGNVDQAILASEGGFFRADVELLDDVVSGQRLGTIKDLFGQTITEVRANTDGIIIMLRRMHSVSVGDGLALITQYV